MSFLSSIGRLFKKLWDAIRKILAIILIVIAVILIVWAAVFSGGAALVLFGFAISQTAAFVLGALALTGAFLIDAETSKEVVGKIGEAMGDAAGSIGGAIGDVVGGGVGGLLGSSGGTLLMIGVGVFLLLQFGSSGKKKKADSSAEQRAVDDRAQTKRGSGATTPVVNPRKAVAPSAVRKEEVSYGSIPLPA